MSVFRKYLVIGRFSFCLFIYCLVFLCLSWAINVLERTDKGLITGSDKTVRAIAGLLRKYDQTKTNVAPIVLKRDF